MPLHTSRPTTVLAVASLLVFPAVAARGQQMISRVAAVASALDNSPRLRLARTDSSAARANVALARQFENPIAGASFTRSAPQVHYTLDVPLDLPWLRRPRIGAALAGLNAAATRFVFARASLVFDVDTAYTRALVVAGRARLSQRSARDADSLLILAQFRRDAGDASQLDVELATLFAGQSTNTAAADSLDAVSGLLAVQAVMGIAAVFPTIVLADSLALDASAADANANETAPTSTTLLIRAAEDDVRAADLSVLFERRRYLATPSLSLGVESANPGGPGGALPLIGVSLPLPLFNRNGATTDAARVAAERARAQLAQTRIELDAALAEARRDAVNARSRATRSARLVAGADRVASLSLLAYREGASTLPNVLESQRSARETLAQYLADVAAARNATALVRLLSLSVTPSP